MDIISSWSIWVGLIGCAICFFLATSRIALAGISGGIVRKLEQKNEHLAEHLDKYLTIRDEIRIRIRILFIINIIVIIFSFSCWDQYCRGLELVWYYRLLPVIIGAFIFFVLTEHFGRYFADCPASRFLTWTVPPIMFLSSALFIITIPAILWHRWSSKWRQEHIEEDEKSTAEDEIISLIEEKDEENGDDSLEDDERRMIKGIFDLDETYVHEIMTPRVDLHGIECNCSIVEVKEEIVKWGHSRIPVYEDSIDKIIGVIIAKDLLNEELINNCNSIKELCHQPVFIPETKNVGDLLTEFQQNNKHLAIILDEYGGTAGLITFEDILEEIVGEIRDEYDHDEHDDVLEEVSEEELVTEARIQICDVNEKLDISLPEDEDYDTLGGYISTHFGRIPEVGETLTGEDHVMEILEADSRRVLKARVIKVNNDTDNSKDEDSK